MSQQLARSRQGLIETHRKNIDNVLRSNPGLSDISSLKEDLAETSRLLLERQQEIARAAAREATWTTRPFVDILPFPDPHAAGLDMTQAANVTLYTIRKSWEREAAYKAEQAADRLARVSDSDKILAVVIGAILAAQFAPVAEAQSTPDTGPRSCSAWEYWDPHFKMCILDHRPDCDDKPMIDFRTCKSNLESQGWWR